MKHFSPNFPYSTKYLLFKVEKRNFDKSILLANKESIFQFSYDETDEHVKGFIQLMNRTKQRTIKKLFPTFYFKPLNHQSADDAFQLYSKYYKKEIQYYEDSNLQPTTAQYEISLSSSE